MGEEKSVLGAKYQLGGLLPLPIPLKFVICSTKFKRVEAQILLNTYFSFLVYFGTIKVLILNLNTYKIKLHLYFGKEDLKSRC